MKELEYARETEIIKHNFKLKEIEFEKKCRIEVEKFKHINDLEIQRIRAAEIKKSIIAKDNAVRGRGPYGR